MNKNGNFTTSKIYTEIIATLRVGLSSAYPDSCPIDTHISISLSQKQ